MLTLFTFVSTRGCSDILFILVYPKQRPMITTTSTIFDGRVSLTCCGRRVLSPAWSYFQNDKTTLWYRAAVDPHGERAVSYCEGLRFDSSNK